MKNAFQVANQHIEQAGLANKRRYDAKIRAVPIGVGDRVLVRNLGERGGTGKLRSWWEQKIYEVVSINELVHVYTVRPLGEKKTKVVHRNMISRVNELPLNAFGQDQEVSKKTMTENRRSRNIGKTKRSNPEAVQEPGTSNSSDTESDVGILIYHKASTHSTGHPDTQAQQTTHQTQPHILELIGAKIDSSWGGGPSPNGCQNTHLRVAHGYIG